MADIDVLSAKLEVKDTFTSQLNKFIKAVDDSEKAFDKFMTKLEQSTSKMEQSIDKVSRKYDQFTQKINTINKNISNSIENSTKKVEQVQTSSIDNISKKYSKMGTDIQGVFKSINKSTEDLAKSGIKINLGGSNTKKENEDSTKGVLGGIFSGDKTESFLGGILSGNFTRILGTMSLIGAGITGMKKVLDTIDGWMQQGFNVINTLSGNLLSYEGLKEGLQEASQFQTNRIAMDTLYNNDAVKGQKYYAMGTKLAKETPYSETSVGALQKKLAGAGINYDDKQLMTLLDVASIKPELGAEHVGFSVVDSMAGRSTSLKTNYMLDNKEINKYLQSLQKSNPTNYAKWKDAFNKTGTVNNKQEYFELLINYVQKQTSYNGLTEKYSHTISGMIDRLQGNWETLKADLLGIDANNTGMMKPGKITVVSAFNDFMTNLNTWLDDGKTKTMLTDFGEGLGKGIKAITDALSDLLKNVNWGEVGKVLKDMGDSVARLVNSLTSNPAFMKFLDTLPDLVERILNSKVIDAATKGNQAKDVADNKPAKAVADGVYGWWAKVMNNFGILSPETATSTITSQNENNNLGFFDNASRNAKEFGSNFGMGFNNFLTMVAPMLQNRAYLTNANADTVLAQNPNLTDDQRKQVKDAITEETNKGRTIYNITVGEVKTDGDVMDLINKLQNLQSNQK